MSGRTKWVLGGLVALVVAYAVAAAYAIGREEHESERYWQNRWHER